MKCILPALLLLPLVTLPSCKPTPDTQTPPIADSTQSFDFKALSRKQYFDAIRNYEEADVKSGRKGLYAQTLSTLGRADITSKDNLLRDPRHKCGKNLRPARPLADWLPNAAKGHTLVIINEDHRRPRDRAFILDVLKTLRPFGYTHYAAETFSPNIGDSTERFAKYGDGYYIEDPVFGKLLTYAKHKGFNLVAYEQTHDQFAPEGADAETRIATRETAQANNLLEAVLKDSPSTKMIIHVGHSHVAERPIPNRSGDGESEWMAARLKKLTGIDPLTISQTDCRTDGARTITLTEEENLERNALTLFTDLTVGHPPQTFTKGRPNWRRENGDIDVPVPTEWLGQIEAMIVEARPAGQSEDAIPIDLVAILPGETDIPLLLPTGKYDIQAYTEKGVIGERIISVRK